MDSNADVADLVFAGDLAAHKRRELHRVTRS